MNLHRVIMATSILGLGSLHMAHVHAVECELLSEDIWDTGFSLEYRVTNNASDGISEWQVMLDLPDAVSLESHWDSVRTGTSPLVLGNASWNGNLDSAGSTVFGFSGSRTGDFSPPTCVDARQAAMEVPVLDDAVVESLTGNYGFAWRPVDGAVKYQVEKTTLDENGDPTEWALSFETTTPSGGFGHNAVGHYGFRVNQCDVDNICSGFSNIKTAVVYKFNAGNINTVTGNYNIEVDSPYPVDLMENGVVIRAGITRESLEVRHQDSGQFEYQLSGLNNVATIEVERFDPDIEIDRSVFIHDEATLDATALDLGAVFDGLAEQFNELNPTDPISGEQLFARVWDAQNPADGETATAVEHCTETLHGYPMTCRPGEGAQAFAPAEFIDRYRLISLVNRLDLRDRREFSNCGEARAIYALTGGSRNLLIFEAELPNPLPGNEAGCLPIAQFWHSLNTVDDTQERASLLTDFFLDGLPGAGVAPVLHINNFGEDAGQLRTNQFMESAWLLKEYKAGTRNGLNTLFLASVKNNPVGELFDVGSSIPQAAQFRESFANGVSNLSGGLAFIKLPALDDIFNNNQSHSSGPLSAENNYASHFANSVDSDFEELIELRLSQSRIDLSVEQLLNRATAMTCGGCHQPAAFGLTAPDAVGPGQSWPDSLGFVHVLETPRAGVYPLSEALTGVFLPDRRDDFETYLSTGDRTNGEETFIDAPDAVLDDEVESGDRSG